MIQPQISINDTRLRVRLDDLPKELQDRLEQTIRGLTNELLRKVEAKEPVRTGRLRRLTHAYVDRNEKKNFIRGRVRVLRTGEHNTAAAAGALEYGAPGKRRKGKVEVEGYSRAGVGVGDYERRRPRIAAQRFLRGPAAVMIPKARQEIARVLNQTTAAVVKN